MDAFEAIHRRRSVRGFTGAGVAREDLLKIVDAGRLAASGNNRQPWEFVVITRRETITALAADKPWLEQAGAIIAVVLDVSSRWWLEDGAAAVENVLLAATALGYGSCWLEGFTLRNEEAFKTLLGIPPEKRLLTIVPIGVPSEWPVKDKKPLEAVVYWERYPGESKI
jgi:nitroreductase